MILFIGKRHVLQYPDANTQVLSQAWNIRHLPALNCRQKKVPTNVSKIAVACEQALWSKKEERKQRARTSEETGRECAFSPLQSCSQAKIVGKDGH